MVGEAIHSVGNDITDNDQALKNDVGGALRLLAAFGLFEIGTDILGSVGTEITNIGPAHAAPAMQPTPEMQAAMSQPAANNPNYIDPVAGMNDMSPKIS